MHIHPHIHSGSVMITADYASSPRQKSFLLKNQYNVQYCDQSQFVTTVTKTSTLSIDLKKFNITHNRCPEVQSATASFQTITFITEV